MEATGPEYLVRVLKKDGTEIFYIIENVLPQGVVMQLLDMWRQEGITVDFVQISVSVLVQNVKHWGIKFPKNKI